MLNALDWSANNPGLNFFTKQERSDSWDSVGSY